MAQPHYQQILGAGERSSAKGRPIPQGIITTNAFIDVADFDARKRDTRVTDYIYQQDACKKWDDDIERLLIDEIAIAYNDVLNHGPSLSNDLAFVDPHVLQEQRAMYPEGDNTLGFMNIFTQLNRVYVQLPDRPDHALVYGKIYKAILDKVNTGIGYKYFPKTYEHLLSHFAFRFIGITKTDQLQQDAIALDVGGITQARATEHISPFKPVEWYLIEEKDLLGSEYASVLNFGTLPDKKILVGLRENYCDPSLLVKLAVKMADMLENEPALHGVMEDLLREISLFMTCRVFAQSQNIAMKGEKCTILVGRGGYAA